MGELFSNPRAIAFAADGMSLLVADVYSVTAVDLIHRTVETRWNTLNESWYATGQTSSRVTRTCLRWRFEVPVFESRVEGLGFRV